MTATLTAQRRTGLGKSAVRKLRREGQVPAVIYGHNDETRALSISTHDLEKLLATISVENTIIDLQVDGSTVPVLIREVQYHPARPILLHVDLYQVHAGEKIHLDVPVRLHGAPLGVRENGGVLQEVLRDLSIECLPRDIPEAVDIDVSGLNIGDTVHIRDVSLPNVRFLQDPELVICTVSGPTVQALPEVPEADLGVSEVQPELIRRRDADAADVPFDQGSSQPE